MQDCVWHSASLNNWISPEWQTKFPLFTSQVITESWRDNTIDKVAQRQVYCQNLGKSARQNNQLTTNKKMIPYPSPETCFPEPRKLFLQVHYCNNSPLSNWLIETAKIFFHRQQNRPTYEKVSVCGTAVWPLSSTSKWCDFWWWSMILLGKDSF